MKNLALRACTATLCLAVFLSLSAHAQIFGNPYPGMEVNGAKGRSRAAMDTLPYRYNVVLMPLSFLGQGLELGSEFLLGKKTSIRVGGGYFLGTNPSFYNDSEDYSGWRGELQLRFLSGDVATDREAYYLGPFLQVKHIRLERKVIDRSNQWVPIQTLKVSEVTAPSFGVLMGYQTVFPQGFIVDTFLGGGLILPDNKAAAREVHIGFVNPYNRGVILRGGIGIGLAR